MTTKILY